ncbi:phosphoribosyl-AMP cyclohydrolase [Aestuariispira insulae]|uniref:Phosphoribosyl-AMP cyclohydrolase n=1 Tax=Aestuariispira insulae TaxID=1461337 RepID=A0A3D9HN29_9PROT|nr:phosphoribosyl-AMP cyclohydrolase [Aestuariispira insulae]RED50894.1 phosphoribosyl-AMP cyclohydrolase [Aestuariispira insulae]
MTERNKLSKSELEEGSVFAPKFGSDGLLPVVATHAKTGDVLMMAYMNEESLELTIQTGEAHYWSRSRGELWHKGATSGQVQKVTDIRTDCDQDAIWIKILPGGDGGCCHVGYESCFYRSIPVGGDKLEPAGIRKLR